MTASTLAASEFPKRASGPALRFKRILAPIDFSRASKNGLQYALRFAEEFGAELTLPYVLEPAPSANFVAIPGVAQIPSH
jgi:nucleotide-binding universal stress UspA family protein